METKDFREQYIADICRLLEDQAFINRYSTKKAFLRNRKITFIFLVVLIMQSMTRSIQRELNSFYQKIKGEDFSIQEVTKSAFSHARKKLSPQAFVELNKEGIKSFYSNAPYLKWNGYRLVAIDGSTLALPNHPTIENEFGLTGFGQQANVLKPMARISMLYDVLNLTTLDAQIASFDTDERTLAKRHFPALNPGSDLLIMDRGYAGFTIAFELQKQGIDYCIRSREDWWPEVGQMLEDGEIDKIVTIKKNQQFELWPKMRLFYDELTCRIVIVELPSGGLEILITSLVDQQAVPYESFVALYAKRWNIEEGYKLYKTRIGLEIFSGKTAQAIKQDFYAKVFMMTTMAVFAFPVEEQLKKEENTKKHTYKVNRTNALSLVKEMSIGIFIKKAVVKTLQTFDKILKATLEIVRPNRKNPRKKRQKNPPSMNYKQL